MKILHINTSRGWRGGEQQTLNLIRGLKSFPVTQYAAGQPDQPFLERTADHVQKCVTLKTRGEINLSAVVKLARFIKKESIQILHSHTAHALSLALQAKWLCPSVQIVAHRRVDFKIKSNPFSLHKYKTPKVNRIMAISKCIEQILTDQSIPAEKIVQVYSAVDPDRFKDVDQDAVKALKDELDITAGTFVIGNVAALADHKDHKTLITALSILRKEKIPFRMFILGEGSERQAIQTQIHSLGLLQHVHLLGFRNDLQNFMALFDLVVHSSKEEGLGTSIIDGLASGVPVVATNAGGIPEILGDSEYGLLVPKENPQALADAIIRMMDSPKLQKHYSQAGRKRAEAFSISVMSQKIFEVYRDLVQ